MPGGAQDVIFEDDFESADLCFWDVALGHPPCPDCTARPDGAVCGDPIEADCGPCGNFTSAGDETGTRLCTCTTFTCSAGQCVSATSACSPVCLRDTDGDFCGVAACGSPPLTFRDLCCSNGLCNTPCGPCLQ